MNKLKVTDLIELNGKSKEARLAFIKKITFPISSNKPKTGGGNYWVRSKSALKNAFVNDEKQIIKNKIDDINIVNQKGISNKTATMYERNISILQQYIEFDFSEWKPNNKLTFLRRTMSNSTISLGDLPLQVIPDCVFVHKEKSIKKVGAIIFITKLESYNRNELEIYCESLYQYLKYNYSKDYEIDKNYCLIVDLINMTTISHSEIAHEKVSDLIKSLLSEIRSNI